MSFYSELKELIDLNLTTEAYILAAQHLITEYGADLGWCLGQLSGIKTRHEEKGHMCGSLSDMRRKYYLELIGAAKAGMSKGEFAKLRSII